MTNRMRAGIFFFIVAVGLAGCGGRDSPAAPSALPSVPQVIPQPTGIQPTVTAMAPRVGSTRGGAWATITGADFQRGATVRLGDSVVTAWLNDNGTIGILTTAHPPGTVDLIVTNPGGMAATLTGAYAYAPPESFDFNGDWMAHAGPDYETDMRFTVRNNVLVTAWCGSSAPVTFAPAPSVHDGEFSFLDDDGFAFSGTLVSPVNAVGMINVPGCPTGRWWADKSSERAGSFQAARGRDGRLTSAGR
jgi:hypothetical protein